MSTIPRFSLAGTEPIEVRVNAAAVEVVDGGLGIDMTDAGRTFGRFYRAAGTSVPGSSLGLATVTDVAA